jgi:hypothetical protein
VRKETWELGIEIEIGAARTLDDWGPWGTASPKPPPTTPTLLHMQGGLNSKPALSKEVFRRMKSGKQDEIKEALALRVILSGSVP